MDHQIEETHLIPKKQYKLRFRDQIFLNWGWCCAYCGGMLGERDATLDHVIPKVQGGLTVRNNLVACCLGCNSRKAHHPWRTWYRGQEFWTESRERWIEQWLEE